MHMDDIYEQLKLEYPNQAIATVEDQFIIHNPIASNKIHHNNINHSNIHHNNHYTTPLKQQKTRIALKTQLKTPSKTPAKTLLKTPTKSTRNSSTPNKNINEENGNNKQRNKQMQSLTKICENIKQQVYYSATSKFSLQLHEIVSSNFEKTKQRGNQKQHKNNDNRTNIQQKKKKNAHHDNHNNHTNPSKKSLKKLIIPITIKKNQSDDIYYFLNQFHTLIANNYSAVTEQQEDSNMANRINHKMELKKNNFPADLKNKKNMFLNSTKINIYKTTFQTVTMVAEYIYINYQMIHNSNDLTILWTEQPTNLNLQNIKVFSKGLASLNCILILPTYHSFKDYNHDIEDLQVIPLGMFDSRALFCNFMYKCVVNKQLQLLHLPQESMKIMDEMKSFPISFHEGCRRLIFIIKKYHMLSFDNDVHKNIHNNNSPQNKSKQIHKLFQLLRQCFQKRLSRFNFSIDYDFINQINTASILSYKPYYFISQKILCVTQLYSSTEVNIKKNPNQIVKKFRERIQARLGLESGFQQYCYILKGGINRFERYGEYFDYLAQQERKLKKTVKRMKTKNIKKTQKNIIKNNMILRSKRLNHPQQQSLSQLQSEIQKDDDSQRNYKFTSQKQLLECQLAHLIKKYISNISPSNGHKYKKRIQWEHLNYNNTIKPMIPLNIHNSVITNNLISDIYSDIHENCDIMITDLIQQRYKESITEKQEPQVFGKTMFVVKQLLKYGLITIKGIDTNPIINRQFYGRINQSQEKQKNSP